MLSVLTSLKSVKCVVDNCSLPMSRNMLGLQSESTFSLDQL